MMKCTAAFLLGGVSAKTVSDFQGKKLNRRWKSQVSWKEPPVKQDEMPAQAQAVKPGPRQFVRATLNIMRAVYTTIEEIQDSARRQLRGQSNSSGPEETQHPKPMSLTQMLEYELAQRQKEWHQKELDEFVQITDKVEARIKRGDPRVGNTKTHKANDGRFFRLTDNSITGVSHGTFKRITTDDGQLRWIWHSLEHCPQEWHILDSPDPSAELMIFNNYKSKISVIAFRGSESEIGDWETNFDAVSDQLHMTSKNNEDDFMSVKGHEGFIKAFNRNRGWLRHALHKHIPEDFDIVVTGHSQGAALAYIGALVTTVEFGRHVSAVLPYAAPKLGKDDLNALYEEQVGCEKTLHMYANYDPVPRVPPSMGRPCQGLTEHELTCEFSIWHFWKCHYADTYQREVRALMESNDEVLWNAGCERD